MSGSNIKQSKMLQLYLDDIGTFTPSYDEIHAEDLGIPEDTDLYRLTDIDSLNDSRSKYSVREKLQAVTIWVLTGNLHETSRKLGISVEAIKYWKREKDWWKEAVARIKLQRNEKLDADLTRCMDLSIEQIQDRIINGDEVILKDGEKARKKLNGKDLAVMLSILKDKRAMMRGDTAISRSERNTQTEVLSQLKDSFEKMSKDIKRNLEEKVVSEQ